MRKWTETEITRLLDIPYPIIQGPFGRGGSSPLLAATVSNAGGLGSFGAKRLGSGRHYEGSRRNPAADGQAFWNEPLGFYLRSRRRHARASRV